MNSKNLLTNKAVVTFLALLCTALWGTAFSAIKQGYKVFSIDSGDIPSLLVFAGIRFFSAGLLIYIALIIIKRKFIAPKPKVLLKMSALGIVQTALQYIFLYVALVLVTGTKSSIYSSFSAFLGVLLAPLFFKREKLTARKVIGCSVGFCGILLINLSTEGNNFGSFTLLGDSFLLLSNLCGALGNIFSKKLSGDSNPILVSATQLTAGGVLLILCGLAMSGGISFDSANCYFIMGYLALISSAAFAIWTILLKYNDVSIISTFMLAIPMFGTISSGIVLRENIFTLVNVVSILLVATGVVIVNIKAKVYDNQNPKGE